MWPSTTTRAPAATASSKASVQLLDERGGQRVVVVRGVQRQPGDPALAVRIGPVPTSVGPHSSKTAAGPARSARRSSRIISRLTGAMRASRDAVSTDAMPYSLVSPLPPSDCTAWSTARTEASPAAYVGHVRGLRRAEIVTAVSRATRPSASSAWRARSRCGSAPTDVRCPDAHRWASSTPAGS